MNEFVFIGTSPINLLKGYLVAKEDPNCRVTFIDKHERLGGAWYSDRSPEGNEIECGCHIWTYCPEVYDYLSKNLGLEMETMSPSPVFKYGKTNLSYPLYTIKNSYQYILKNFVTLQFSKLNAIKNNPEISWRIVGKKNQYPTKGSPVLILKLKEMLDNLDNVSFKFGLEITEVICGERITLRTKTDQIICDELFTTSVSSFNKIKNDKEALELSHKQRDYIHILARSKSKPNYKVTYHRLVNDSIIHRITDVSYQTKEGEYLFLAGILEPAFEKYSSDELTLALKKYLIENKVINKNGEIEYVKSHVFPTYYIEKEARERLEKFDPRVHCFYSIDLMYGFYYILKEHKLI